MSPLPSRCSAPMTSRMVRRIHAGRHAEADARREVGLDQAGDDVHAGPLRGEHQVHADSARHLRQTRDGFFHVLAFEHHQVGQLVDQDQDVTAAASALLVRLLSSSNRIAGLLLHFADFLVELIDVARAVFGEQAAGGAPFPARRFSARWWLCAGR